MYYIIIGYMIKQRDISHLEFRSLQKPMLIDVPSALHEGIYIGIYIGFQGDQNHVYSN